MWETVAAIVALAVAVATAAFTFGVLKTRVDATEKAMEQHFQICDDEIKRARDRIDRMERDIVEFISYWKRQ